jgi:AcrR family transcriptional regulator
MPINPASPRKIQAEKSRKKILETAIELFDKKGYENVSIAEICEKAGFSTGSFYHYFKSKDQVLEERYLPFAKQLDAFFKSIYDSVQWENKSSVEKLAKFTEILMDYTDGVGVEALKAAYRLQIEPGTTASPKLANFYKPHEIVKEIIEEGQEKGEIRADISASDISSLLYYFVFGIFYSWCLPGTSLDLREAGKQYLALVIDGLRKR